MRPNKFGCTWLGQGGALKVVSEGFGSAMMLKEFFSDSMIQIFLPKTAEKLKTLWGDCGAALRGLGGDFEPHHRKELIEICILAGSPHDPMHQNPKNRSPLCPKSVGFRGLVAIRSEVPPKGAAGAPSGKSAQLSSKRILCSLSGR